MSRAWLPDRLHAPAAACLLAALSAAGGCGNDIRCGVEGGQCETYHEVNNRARGDAPRALVWAVFRDGESSAWSRLDDPTGFNRFSLPEGSTGLTVAYVCERTQTGEIVYMDRDERANLDVFCGIPYNDPNALELEWSGKIEGVGDKDRVTLTLGSWWHGVRDVPVAPGATQYAAKVDSFQHDLAALAESSDRPLRLLVRRQLISTAPKAVADLDFAGALEPEQRPFVLPAATPGERVEAGVSFTTEKERASLALPLTVPGHAPVFGKRDLMADDIQELWVDAADLPAGMRGYAIRLGDGPIPARPLPPAFTSTEVAYAAAAPAGRPRASFAPYPKATFYQMVVSPAGPTPAFTWIINVGARWLAKHTAEGGKPSFELPDLKALPGFQAAWAPDTKVPVLVEVVAVTSTRRFGDVINNEWRDAGPGAETTYAKKVVSLPPAAP